LVTNSFLQPGIHLGNGDGTLRAVEQFESGQSTLFAVLGEFNGDSKADLAIGDTSRNELLVHLGGAIRDLAVSISPGDGLTQGQ
jgi:hypothetical protein